MSKVMTGYILVVGVLSTAAALETCSNNAKAQSSTTSAERAWAGYSSSVYLLQDRVAELCSMVPECKAKAQAERDALQAYRKAEREAAMTPSKPRGPIPEQAEFKKRLGEVKLVKER